MNKKTFKELSRYKYNKNFCNFQTFVKVFFKKFHRFGTMERTWYSSYTMQRRTYCSSSD